MTDYFKACESIEEGKKIYRQLLKEFHPDHNIAGLEITKQIVIQFRHFIDTFIEDSFKKAEKEFDTKFSDILSIVLQYNITIKIIGTWIYAYNSYSYKDQLSDLDFWFSKKHKAWIYSGGKKKYRATSLSIDDIKNNYGCSDIKEQKVLT